jgi:hypothetical protein
VKILPRLASSAPFLCLIVAHLEWPDMVYDLKDLDFSQPTRIQPTFRKRMKTK